MQLTRIEGEREGDTRRTYWTEMERNAGQLLYEYQRNETLVGINKAPKMVLNRGIESKRRRNYCERRRSRCPESECLSVSWQHNYCINH